MPNGRRKIPFSCKRKKQQLIAKRQSKQTSTNPYLLNKSLKDETDTDEIENKNELDNVEKINFQPAKSGRNNRYIFHFHRETEKQLKEIRAEARKPITLVPEKELEIDDQFFISYDFPKRPQWSFEMSKEQLERNENKYFRDYMQKLEKIHYDDKKLLSYCELNLETWRQLWRVLELSDIILVICDIRYPALMFPPSLFEYVTTEINKRMILLLNKIDLAPSTLVLAWKKYFEEKYPNIHILVFTSYPSNLQKASQNLQTRRRRGKLRMAAEGALEVFKACDSIVNGEIDLSSWQHKILDEMNGEAQNYDDEDDKHFTSERIHEEEKDFDFQPHEKFKNGVLTIGCVGYPNVGKSSLMNALIGKKVVSVSKTPGHTKHFQTIFLTNTVRLCDSPGLVFPSSTPRNLQVLMGSYPIAQLREPYGSIRFLAEHINLTKILNIDNMEGFASCEWSAITICDAWAVKRGFWTAKTARPDTYRSANNILRMALDGKLTLCLRPLGYSNNIDIWSVHSDLEIIKKIQVRDDIIKLDELNSVEYSEDEEDLELDSSSKNECEDEIATENAFSVLEID